MKNSRTVNKKEVLTGTSRLKFIVAIIAFTVVILLFFRTQLSPETEVSTIQTPEISINPAYAVVEKGEEFSINISINPADAPVSAAQFNLLFDNSILNIKDTVEGDFFKKGGAKTAFNAGTLDKKRGALINVWGLIITPGTNVTTKGTLATITMYANNAGTSQLNLTDVIVSNPGNNPAQVKITNGSISVKEAR